MAEFLTNLLIDGHFIIWLFLFGATCFGLGLSFYALVSNIIYMLEGINEKSK